MFRFPSPIHSVSITVVLRLYNQIDYLRGYSEPLIVNLSPFLFSFWVFPDQIWLSHLGLCPNLTFTYQRVSFKPFLILKGLFVVVYGFPGYRRHVGLTSKFVFCPPFFCAGVHFVCCVFDSCAQFSRSLFILPTDPFTSSLDYLFYYPSVESTCQFSH